MLAAHIMLLPRVFDYLLALPACLGVRRAWRWSIMHTGSSPELQSKPVAQPRYVCACASTLSQTVVSQVTLMQTTNDYANPIPDPTALTTGAVTIG